MGLLFMKNYKFIIKKLINSMLKKKRKDNNLIFRIFNINILKIRYSYNKKIYFLFDIVPIFSQKHVGKIQLHYFNTIPNFGDLLNINLFKFWNKDIEIATIENINIVAIGSILSALFNNRKLNFKEKLKKIIRKPVIVYGSGFLEESEKDRYLLRKLHVIAVRGYYSLNKLKKFKEVSFSQNLVIGDPGLLSKYLFDISDIKKKYDLGIIPHYDDRESPLLKKINVKNSVIIDIQQEPVNFIKQIAECKNIISSAMHGLIAADSLGIPNIRMILSHEVGDYKFKDYYSAFGIKKFNYVDLNLRSFSDKDIELIYKNYKIKKEDVDSICKKLIDVFPYKD